MKRAVFALSLLCLFVVVTLFTLGSTPTFNQAASGPQLGFPAKIEQRARVRLLDGYGKLPLSFEANEGQTSPEVKFLSRGPGYTLFLTANEAVLALHQSQSNVQSGKSELKEMRRPRGSSLHPRAAAILRMKLLGANPRPKVEALDQLPGNSNYFTGNDPNKWRTNVPNYAKVQYESIYPGIDLLYYGNQRQLEYDFVVAPGADPKAIQMALAGADGVATDGQGNLMVSIEGGEVCFHKPLVYQPESPQSKITDHKFLDGRYVLLAQNRIGFEVASYDSSEPLVIDPVLSYSTYLGGSIGDWADGIAVDSSGNAYVTGGSISDNFPTMNPIQAARAIGTCGVDPDTYPCPDAIVSKLNATGDALVYSTYLGGTDFDWGHGIAVDSSGTAYVTGETSSSDFPVAPPYNTYQGGGDIFLAKVDPAGSALTQSSPFGDTRYDTGIDIAVDDSGNAYLAGVEETAAGDEDGFMMIVYASGPVASSHAPIGGSANDWAEGIALDSNGDIYVAGTTFSADFTTSSAFQSTFGGGTCGTEPDTFPCPDAFVRKYLATGGFTYSTYLGGTDYDRGYAVAVDSSDNIYVVGMTFSDDFPTQSPLQATHGGDADVFVTKFNAGGSTLAYSTYLGGSGGDSGRDVAVDSSGNAYVGGTSGSNAFPTANPIQAARAGNFDAVVAKLNPPGSALIFSTYLGGTDWDEGYALALDSSGNAYVTGMTWSADFPTANALQPTLAGVANVFVSKISFVGISLVPASLDFGTVGVGATSSAQVVTLSNDSDTVLTISAISTSGDFAQTNDCGGSLAAASSCSIDVTFTPTAVGTRTGELTVTSDDPDSPHLVSLTGTGDIVPGVSLSPDSLSFASQLVGTTSAPKTVTLSNPGSATLNITSIAPMGDFAQTNDCGSSLAASASCTISVTFTPTVEGTLTGQITVTSDAPDSPHLVTLSGTGTQAQPEVSLSTTLVDFGERLVGTTSDARTVMVTNTGNAALTITNVAFTGGDTDQFVRGTTDCVSSSPIAAGGQCTLSLSFKPTVVGDSLAEVSIVDDAPGSPHTVILTGTGTDFTFEISSGSSSSATVNAGQSATYGLELEPTGFSGTVTLACTHNVTRGSCSVSPASVTLDGSTSAEVTVTATTTAPSMAPPATRLPPPGAGGRVPAPWLSWLLILALLAGATLVARRRAAWGLAVAMLSVMLWAGCGGDSEYVPTPQPGTPAGTYEIEVTATASGLSKPPITLTLTVR